MTKFTLKNHKEQLFQTSIFFQHSEKIREIIEKLNTKRVVIINGIHNAWKTSVMNELIKKIGREKEVFHFDKQYDLENQIKSWKDIQKFFILEVKNNPQIKIIILKNINKIDNIKEFLNFVYLDNNKYKIIIISNTIKINNCDEVHIYPEKVNNIWKYFDIQNQLLYGTFPEVLLLGHNHFRKKHLQLMLNDIFTKDIYHSFWVKNIWLFDFFIRYLSKNNTFFSLRELHKCISQHIQISLKTVIDYTNFAQQSKIILWVNPFDFKKWKIISTKSKYYFTDTGMRNSLCLFCNCPQARKENLLYQQLLAYWYEIYTGINGTFEFNFYVKKDQQNICIHFWEFTDKQEIKKEINKLNKVPVNGKKYLVTQDIQTLNIRKYIYDDVEIISYENLFKKLFFS